jgi:hypothetical protein
MTTMRVGFVVLLLWLGMSSLVIPASTGGKDEAVAFEKLLERHHQDISTSDGKAYEKAFMSQYEKTFGAVLGNCIEQTGSPTAFDLILVVGNEGRVTNGASKPRSKLADCVIQAARKDTFPRPPKAPFHIDIVQKFEP